MILVVRQRDIMSYISKMVSRMQPTISIGNDGLPNLTIEFKDAINAENVDDRIARL